MWRKKGLFAQIRSNHREDSAEMRERKEDAAASDIEVGGLAGMLLDEA